MSNKFEKLIEFIINDEQDKARDVFHEIVVEKSRDIYESLIDEQDLEEVGGNPVDELIDEVTVDETGISEEEDEECAEEMDLDTEEDHSDQENEEELEDRVVDLEDALDELKAEFDALMAGEKEEPEHADMEMSDEEESDEEGEELPESTDEIVREYVEKAPAPVGTEEGSVNKQSTVASKNDMGGTSKNLNQGQANANPDGTSPKSTVKPKGNLPHADQFENVPGGDAGNAFAKKESAKKEDGDNTTSPVGSK